MTESSAPTWDDPVQTAVLVTEVVSAPMVAALCRLAGVDARIWSQGQAVALLTDPATAKSAAAACSRGLVGTQVLLLERRQEAVDAEIWVNGEVVEDVAPGVAIAQSPDEVELVILGTGELPDTQIHNSRDLSRWKALRQLVSSGRRPS